MLQINISKPEPKPHPPHTPSKVKPKETDCPVNVFQSTLPKNSGVYVLLLESLVAKLATQKKINKYIFLEFNLQVVSYQRQRESKKKERKVRKKKKLAYNLHV